MRKREYLMENELKINREKIIKYYAWHGYLSCATFVLVCGIGLLMGVVWYVITVTWLPLWVSVLRYSLDEKALRVEKGRLFKSRKTIPLEKSLTWNSCKDRFYVPSICGSSKFKRQVPARKPPKQP